MSKSNVRQRRLGAALRRFRERSGLNGAQAGSALGVSAAMISHVENGKRAVDAAHLESLLNAYGITDQTVRERMLTLGDAARRVDWFSHYRNLGPAFRDYLSLESEASTIRDYQSQCVSGLFQTEAYARAILASGMLHRDAFEDMVSVRMERQNVLERPDPPKVLAILDEPVLRRPVGGRSVLYEQLRRLLKLAERPNIELRVLPYDLETGVVVAGSFVILQFPEAEYGAAFLENFLGGDCLESGSDIHTYDVIFDKLRQVSLSPDASVELITKAAEEAASDG